MSEYLLESGAGGSIANVAYSPCGVSSTSQKLCKELLDNLFRRDEGCLGRAVFSARCSVIARYPDDDSIYGPAVLWTLFGDPALRIRHRAGSSIEEGHGPNDSSRPRASCPLSAFPNPCAAAVRVCFSCPRQTANRRLVTVYDASGRLVYSEPVRGSSLVIRTSSFPDGVYVVRCTWGVDSASALLVVRH